MPASKNLQLALDYIKNEGIIPSNRYFKCRTNVDSEFSQITFIIIGQTSFYYEKPRKYKYL